MAGSVNKVILVGNLGSDPEVRSTQSGNKVANLRIATGGDRYTDRQTGEVKETRTQWHQIVVFGKTAEICEKYLGKGSKIYVEGELQTRKWQDRDGNDRWTTEVVVGGLNGSVKFLDSKNDNGNVRRGSSQADANSADQAPLDQGDDDDPFAL